MLAQYRHPVFHNPDPQTPYPTPHIPQGVFHTLNLFNYDVTHKFLIASPLTLLPIPWNPTSYTLTLLPTPVPYSLHLTLLPTPEPYDSLHLTTDRKSHTTGGVPHAEPLQLRRHTQVTHHLLLFFVTLKPRVD